MTSERITWTHTPRTHHAIRMATGVSISTSLDGTTTVTESGHVEQCASDGLPWPCLIADNERLRAELAATQAAASEMHTELLRMAPFAALSGYTSTIATGDPSKRGAAILAAAHKLAEACRVIDGITKAAFVPSPDFDNMNPATAARELRAALIEWQSLNVGGREPSS